MKKYNIGDCFIDTKNKNIIRIISILDDFCTIKLINENNSYTLALHSLSKFVKLGNIYDDETVRILYKL